jgi:hypothetical protein
MVRVIDDLLPHSGSRGRKRRAVLSRASNATPDAPAAAADVVPVAPLTPATVSPPNRATTNGTATNGTATNGSAHATVSSAATNGSTNSPSKSAIAELAPTATDTITAPVRRGRTHKREIVFGILLAVVAAIAITWWITSSREPKPSFEQGVTATTVVNPGGVNTISGGPGPSPSAAQPPLGSGSHAPPATPPTLTRAYQALHSAYVQSRTYKSLPLTSLARLLGLSIEAGTASSTNGNVVSLLVPAPDRMVLAVRNDAGCAWLRDLGRGAQIAQQSQVVITCSAAAAPTTGWRAA